MRLEVLGSGGAFATPKPLCTCEVCTLARKETSKDSRFGPSVFIHGPNILIDTPEEIAVQINRSSIKEISACLYSHWHPDHTMGKRVFQMNQDPTALTPPNRCTKVFFTEAVDATFRDYLGIKGHLEFMEKQGLIETTVVKNNESFSVNGYRVTPVQMHFPFVFGFTIAGSEKKILVVMDEMKFWEPQDQILNERFDLVYLPIGIVDVNPLTGKRHLPPNHPILTEEHTFRETLTYVRRLASKKFVLSHVEEPDGISFEMGRELGRYASEETGKAVEVAYDTQLLEV